MSLCCCLNPVDESTIHLPHDTEVPVKSRKQTDLQYFVILVVFVSFLGICAIVAGSQGNIRRFIYDYDDKGNVCGFKNERIEGISGSGLDFTKKKFLQPKTYCVYSDVCSTRNECVEKCDDGYTPSILSHCVLDGGRKTESSVLEVIYSDLSLCWREIVVLCFCTICLSGLVLTLMRKFAKTVIRITIVIISLAAIGWAVFTWIMVFVKLADKNSAIEGPAFEEDNNLRSGIMQRWVYLAIISTFFLAVFFFMLFKVKSKMPFIIALFEEGGKCMKDIPTMLLQPVLTEVITTAFVCLTVIGIACFCTSGKATIEMDGTVSFPNNVFFQITSWLLFFAFLWLSQFILACQNLVIAGSVSSWYFSRVKGKLVNPVWNSFRTIVKHHLGSSAFGALLIAIIKAIRLITRMMERKSGQNGLSVLIWSFLQCFLACIESLLRILNKTAYVMIVLFGEPFCISARRAYACLSSDSSKAALIIGVGTFLLTAIELLITVSVTFVGIAIFMNIEGVQVFWIPACLVFFLSFACCYCFFSVYEMTIDTLLLCVCVDHQMNNGLEKPYYMNKNLTILLNEDERNPDEMKDGDQNMLVVT